MPKRKKVLSKEVNVNQPKRPLSLASLTSSVIILEVLLIFLMYIHSDIYSEIESDAPQDEKIISLTTKFVGLLVFNALLAVYLTSFAQEESSELLNSGSRDFDCTINKLQLRLNAVLSEQELPPVQLLRDRFRQTGKCLLFKFDSSSVIYGAIGEQVTVSTQAFKSLLPLAVQEQVILEECSVVIKAPKDKYISFPSLEGEIDPCCQEIALLVQRQVAKSFMKSKQYNKLCQKIQSNVLHQVMSQQETIAMLYQELIQRSNQVVFDCQRAVPLLARLGDARAVVCRDATQPQTVRKAARALLAHYDFLEKRLSELQQEILSAKWSLTPYQKAEPKIIRQQLIQWGQLGRELRAWRVSFDSYREHATYKWYQAALDIAFRQQFNAPPAVRPARTFVTQRTRPAVSQRSAAERESWQAEKQRRKAEKEKAQQQAALEKQRQQQLAEKNLLRQWRELDERIHLQQCLESIECIGQGYPLSVRSQAGSSVENSSVLIRQLAIYFELYHSVRLITFLTSEKNQWCKEMPQEISHHHLNKLLRVLRVRAHEIDLDAIEGLARQLPGQLLPLVSARSMPRAVSNQPGLLADAFHQCCSEQRCSDLISRLPEQDQVYYQREIIALLQLLPSLCAGFIVSDGGSMMDLPPESSHWLEYTALKGLMLRISCLLYEMLQCTSLSNGVKFAESVAKCLGISSDHVITSVTVPCSASLFVGVSHDRGWVVDNIGDTALQSIVLRVLTDETFFDTIKQLLPRYENEAESIFHP